VGEVKARIEELLAQVLGPPAEEPRRGSPDDEDGPMHSQHAQQQQQAQAVDSDDSDEDFYARYDTTEACELARSRLNTLLARQKTGERNDMMREVASWLRGRSNAARRDIGMLGRMDQDCSKRGNDIEMAPEEIAGVLQHHGEGTAAAMKEFCETLGRLQSAKRGREKQGKRKSLDLLRLDQEG